LKQQVGRHWRHVVYVNIFRRSIAQVSRNFRRQNLQGEKSECNKEKNNKQARGKLEIFNEKQDGALRRYWENISNTKGFRIS
jgi:hypothetical protein